MKQQVPRWLTPTLFPLHEVATYFTDSEQSQIRQTPLSAVEAKLRHN